MSVSHKSRFYIEINKLQRKNIKQYQWRFNATPYKTIISEIFLQKTDTLKVEKLFSKFIARYSSFQEIKTTDVEELQTFTKDIGLFYRAERLKKIAEQIVDEYGGHIPDTKEELLKLYGVGDYIANAVLCFAYNQRVPLVDTNIVRVYERVFNFESTKSRPRDDKKMWDFAESMLPKENYKRYNYALLDFAADLCNARNPKCGGCPLREICHYYGEMKK